MPITRLDHVTVLTGDVARSVAFYRDVLGLELGPRPHFSFDGAWLYAGGTPAVHLVARSPGVGGVIDHFAFAATGLSSFLARLAANGIAYDVTRLPSGVPQSGTLQLFVRDPDGARVEIDFPADETAAV